MLDPIHNQGLRLALGAFRTSHVASIYVEADEPSFYSRREKISLKHAIRLAAIPSTPAQEVLFPPKCVDLHEKKPKSIISADPGVESLIPARSHTFLEIDHEIISTVILLPSAESFQKVCCQL